MLTYIHAIHVSLLYGNPNRFHILNVILDIFLSLLKHDLDTSIKAWSHKVTYRVISVSKG